MCATDLLSALVRCDGWCAGWVGTGEIEWVGSDIMSGSGRTAWGEIEWVGWRGSGWGKGKKGGGTRLGVPWVPGARCIRGSAHRCIGAAQRGPLIRRKQPRP
eukprot:325071-Chlamydomonas_euryale.AAC.1